jgi:hypothetical protein
MVETSNVKINYGKHKGSLITRLPVSYLRWMANEKAPMSDYAMAEIKRRNHKLPEIEISVHAINNATLRALGFYKRDRMEGEGLYSWLERISLDSIATNSDYDNKKIRYKEIVIVLSKGQEYPILKTVIYKGTKK